MFGDNGGGWRYATNAEVVGLFGKLFDGFYANVTGLPISVSTSPHYVDQQEDVDNMIALFGLSGVSNGNLIALGLFRDGSDRLTLIGAAITGGLLDTTVYGLGYASNYNPDQVFPHIATLVVRNTTVPVPAAVWLFGSSLLGLFGFSRRNRHA